MKLWLDDERDPEVWRPGQGYVWAKSFIEAMNHLNLMAVTEISFDHDLGEVFDQDGDELNGYAIACHIEFMAFTKQMSRIKWHVHSANPVGQKNIKAAMESADRYWTINEGEL